MINEAEVQKTREQLKGCKILSSCAQKGGIGKTLVTVNIAYCLAQRGYKVLVIDTDSQASLSSLCNLLPKEYTDDVEETYGLQDIYEYAVEHDDDDVSEPIRWEAIQLGIVRPTYTRSKRKVKENGEVEFVDEVNEFGFDLIPSDIELANYEQILSKKSDGGLMLYKICNVIKQNSDYDFILIDCPPSLSTLAYNGIAAAVDGVLVPINLEILTLRGAKNLIFATASIQELMWKKHILHKGLLGIIKNQFVPRFKVQQEFSDIVDDFWPIPAFDSSIPNKTSCDVAHKLGLQYSQYDKAANKAFNSLTDEILAKLIERVDEKEPVIINSLGKDVEEKLLSKPSSEGIEEEGNE